MTQALRLSLLLLALLCLGGGLLSLQAQTPTPTPSPTPDPFVIQITSSMPTPLPSPATGNFVADSFARDISGNGRFVAIESNGNIATQSPDNADGNREIFLFDYAQRRIFQITRTRSALATAQTNPPTPNVGSNVVVEVSNNRPALSRDGRWIVFSSNALTPGSFDGDADANETALRADGNQEIWLYRIPDVPDADLTSGAEIPLVDLSQGAFTRVTDTPASRLPTPGTATTSPFVADDNRSASINDDGSRIAFVSTRNLLTANTDVNPEVFVWNRLPAPSFVQVTNTSGQFVFNENPSLSGSSSDSGADSIIAFASNANLLDTVDNASNNADGNTEVYFVRFNGTVVSTRQITRTRTTTAGFVLNSFSPGRRISPDGNFIAFESIATNPGDNANTIFGADTVFVYNVGAGTTTQVGPRPNATDSEVAFRFPTFTGDSSRVVFVSALNFSADGTRLDFGNNAGLNPTDLRPQIFSAPVPAAGATLSFTRLTNVSTDTLASPQPFVSDTQERMAFSFAGIEFGTGNADGSIEAFYQILPPVQGENVVPAADVLQYFTGASERPVASPTATPSPSPTPSPTPVTGLAPGMLAILRAPASVPLASSAAGICPDDFRNCPGASESLRRPALPVELNGVSLSINNAAAGLYFVSPTQISFVVPLGLAATTGTNTLPVVIRIRETDSSNRAVVRTVRSQIQITAAQPDIFPAAPGGTRAAVFNVTGGMMMMAEPPEGFAVTTDVMGQPMPTELALIVTGVRNVPVAQITITIGDRSFSAAQITRVIPTGTPGFDQINFVLRADVAGIGDQPIVVSANSNAFTSRSADTAPRIRIQ